MNDRARQHNLILRHYDVIRVRQTMSKHQEFIGAMSRDELYRSIVEPARQDGWEFESGLVNQILRDVGDERPCWHTEKEIRTRGR